MQKPETTPEKYLREILESQKKNNQLLEKLLEKEEKKITHKKWGTFFKILAILLPYLFSLFVAWTFYAKVQESIKSLTSSFTNFPQTIHGKVSNSWESAEFSGKNTWENRDEYIETLKNTTTNTLENGKNSFEEYWNGEDK